MSLKAATQISLEIITADIKPIKKLSKLMLRPINTNTINNLSAIGSKISPKTDSDFNFQAKYPSRKSEIEARTKNRSAIQ